MGTLRTCDKHRNPRRCVGKIKTIHFAMIESAPGHGPTDIIEDGKPRLTGRMLEATGQVDTCEHGAALIFADLMKSISHKVSKRAKLVGAQDVVDVEPKEVSDG